MEEEKPWMGTPLSGIYGSSGPWSYSIVPIVISKNHHVLYELPATTKEPPKPYKNSQTRHWDDGYVKMPFSSNSLFITKKENGEEMVRPRWDVIKEALTKPINSMEMLQKAIASYNNTLPRFSALSRYLNEILEEEETDHFFTQLLPKIIKLALQLPEIIPGNIPLLKKNHSKSLSLSQVQVASLLANAFLCTLLWKKDLSSSYPGINFIRLFTADSREKRQNCIAEKLSCLLHYFKRVTENFPVGVITFERKAVARNQVPRWDSLDNNLGNTRVHITSEGTIEDGWGLLQVDFANKFVGGGVLGYGCVQEEIRFVICPEAIISRLFTEELSNNEALIITGLERYSNYSGYCDDFKWNGNCFDETPFDEYARRRTTLTVIDATRFSKIKDQYHCSAILRELNKAYIGFSCKEKLNLSPVGTGNWGCGAFKGDPNLKCLIQLMACSATNRDLVYYSFGNTELRDEFYKMYTFLATHQITICQLWRYLCRFCGSNLPSDRLYSFIQQCHFDLKKQPSLKDYLSTSPVVQSTSQKRKNEKNDDEEPSTSFTQKKFPALPITIEPSSSSSSPKVSSEEIIQIIDMIDGKIVKTYDSQENDTTLLSEASKPQREEATEIKMEIDNEDIEDKPLSFIEDKKRKITDYFTKVTSYL